MQKVKKLKSMEVNSLKIKSGIEENLTAQLKEVPESSLTLLPCEDVSR